MVRGSFLYFGWFAAGFCFYVYFKENNRGCFAVGILISLLSSLFIKDANWNTILAAILVSIFSALSLLNIQIQNFLNSRFLLLMGYVSYPLYLIHENMMISIIPLCQTTCRV